MQIAFFVTPVIWKPEQLGGFQKFLPLNPLYDMIEVVRGPMLADPVSPRIWVGAILFSAVVCGVSWAFFVKARGRVAFWV